jgi:hypothetical protein
LPEGLLNYKCTGPRGSELAFDLPRHSHYNNGIEKPAFQRGKLKCASW